MKRKKILDFTAFAIVVIFSVFIGLYILSVGNIDLNVPYGDSGDAYMGLMFFKSISRSGFGGMLFNANIGAPEVSALIDAPFLDWQYVSQAWLLTRFLEPIVAYYVFYITTYVLAGISMCLLMSKVTHNPFLRILFSCAFVITPYHFRRGMRHMTLSNCFVVPLGLYLCILIINEEYKKGIPQKFHNNILRIVLYLVLPMVIGTSNVYYALFCIIIMFLAVITKMIRDKTVRPIFNEAVSLYIVILFAVLSLVPKMIYGILNGENDIPRSVIDTEVYGLKILALFLPPSYSRITVLSDFTNDYSSNGFNINENMHAAMGVIACIGFLVLCVHFIYSFVNCNNSKSQNSKILNHIELSLISLIIYCTSGGFGAIFSYLVMPEFRALNRVSIVLVALSLTGLAILIESIKRVNVKRVCEGILVVVFFFTLYAEVPAVDAHWQDGLKVIDTQRKEFFSEIENQLDSGDMVYQLPYVDFPEVPPLYNMQDYSQFAGYLYTDTLRWSYGGMKGRNTKAKELFIDDGHSQAFLDGIIECGFSGLYIDGYGYEDGGKEIVEYYTELLHQEPLECEDGRLYFFDIRSY